MKLNGSFTKAMLMLFCLSAGLSAMAAEKNFQSNTNEAKESVLGAITTNREKDILPHVNNLNWFGDFRYRYEDAYQEAKATSSLTLNRIRVRLGAKAQPIDELQYELRLASGAGRTSTTQTLGANSSAGDNYNFLLDRAYLTWSRWKGVKIQAGKMANPFFQAGEADLIFDTDLNFDGLSGRFEKDRWFVQASSFQIDRTNGHNTSPDQDVKMNSLSAGFKSTSESSAQWTVGVATHHLPGINTHQQIGTAAGNSTVTVGANNYYTKNYHPLVVDADCNLFLKGNVLVVYAEYAKNDAEGDDNQAYLIGAKLGKLKEKGTWSVAADYRELQKDSTLAAWTDADVLGGGTNGRAIRLIGAYAIEKDFSFSVMAIDGTYGIASSDATSVKRGKATASLDLKF